MDWIFIAFCFPRKKKWDSCYFIQLFPLLFHKNPDQWSRRHPCEGHGGLQKNPPEAVELFHQTLYQGLRTNLLAARSQQFARLFSFPPVLNFAEALLLQVLLPSSLVHLQRVQRVPGHRCRSCYGAMELWSSYARFSGAGEQSPGGAGSRCTTQM